MAYIRIQNPNTDTFTFLNQLVEAARKGENAISVLESTEPDDGFIVIGEPNNKRTELARVNGVSDHQYLLSQPLSESHTQATNIYHTFYKRVELYRTIDGVKQLFQNLEIAWNDSVTLYFDEQYEQLTSQGKVVSYSYNYVNPTNSVRSAEKPAYVGDDLGYTFTNNKVYANEFIRELNKKAFEDEASNKRSPSEWLLDINYALAEVNQEVIEPADDQYFFTQIDFQVIKNKSNYSLPEGMQTLLDVRLNGCTLPARALIRAKQTCVSCGCSIGTLDTAWRGNVCGTCSTPATTTAESTKCTSPCVEEVTGDECENQVCTTKPEYFYAITDKEIIIDPVPLEDGILTLSYYGTPAPFTNESQGTFLPEGYREIVVLGSMFRYYFYNEHGAESQAYADRLYQLFTKQKALLRDKILNRTMGRKPTQKQVVKGIRSEPIFGNQINRYTRPSGFNSFMP